MKTSAFWMAGLASLGSIVLTPAQAQDVPGIEICIVEKTMERRTSCLQSNVDFLTRSIGKVSSDSQQKIDAANRQIETLKASVAGLQKTVEQLQTKIQSIEPKPKEPAAK